MSKDRTSYIPKWNQDVFKTTQKCLDEGAGIIERETDFVRILTGSRSKRIIGQGYQANFSTYGLLKGYQRFYIKAVVSLLLKERIEDLASYVVLVGKEGNERNIGSLLEFLSHENGNIRRLTCSALGRKGRHFWIREAWTFMPQSNLDEKVFVIERLRKESYEGKLSHRGQWKKGEIEYRLGYYIIGKTGRAKGKWVWGQFCPLIPANDLKKLLEKAKREKTII
ncbi:MAG: hypothetical protein JW991_00565 [Candidatus Pacebacteria bacterium]|nr:hypothetical protein [Candidatus Paceibacterota bacterium]